MIRISKFEIIIIIQFVFCSNSFVYASINQSEASACIVQTDGKVIVAGTANNNNINVFCTARYQSNGSLDTSFGTNGYVFTSLGSDMQLFAATLQPSDGKCVVAGFAIVNNVTQLALVRYTISGALDTSFGQSGAVLTPVNDNAVAYAIAIDANNNIVIAGSTVKNGSAKFLLARYLPTGVLDASFGSNGTVTLPIGYYAGAFSLAISSVNGAIVIAGFSSSGVTGEQCTLAGFNSDGSLDTSFGTNGIVITTIGKMSHINSVLYQSNGNIVAAGFSNNNYILARYNSAGVLDNSFGTSGIVNAGIGSVSQANDVIIDANNNLLITGFTDSSLLIARYTSTGILDSSFNRTGQAILLFETLNVGNSLIMQADGKIITAGFADNDFLVARYNTNGIIDTTWGNNGVVNQPGASSTQQVTRIWEQQPPGTNAGTFTSGAWQVRNLNQINTADPSISLSSNQFTLGPGTYDILISVPAYRVGNHQARLQNITDGITVSYGASVFSSSSISTVSISVIGTSLTLLKPTTFQVQHKCMITEANDGLGIAAGIGAAEVYTQIKITPVS